MIAKAKNNNAFPFGWLIVVLLAIFALFASAHGQKVAHVESVGFNVSDMDKALDFYTRILPFEKVSDLETM